MSRDNRFEDDPVWLMQPLERRQVALHRLNVMLDYERHQRPGDAEAEEAARRLGVTTGQFYRIRRQWTRDRDVLDLLPYGRPGATRKPKLDQDVSDAVDDLIKRAVARGFRTPAEILRIIRDGWTLNKPVPSHMTLRKNISEAVEKAKGVAGGLVFLSKNIPPEALESATEYGQVMAIDHICLQVFVATEGGPVAPIITLAIDLFTSSICGFHLSFGAPGPLQFEAVLRDTEVRSEREAQTHTTNLKPRLVFAVGGGSGWAKLLSRIESGGYDADVRASQRLDFGETISVLIGASIGPVKFATRRFLNDLVFNPGRDALISFDELKTLIEDGVRDLNGMRIPVDIELNPLKFDF